MKPSRRDFIAAFGFRTLVRPLIILTGVLIWISGHPIAGNLLLLVSYGVVVYGTLTPTTRLFGPVTTRLPTDEVLLTLDDGPHPDTTPALLDLLDRHEVKAVFFVIGDRVKQWPQLAQEIIRRGHAIGNHSQTHPSGWFWLLGPRHTWREIARCQDTLREAIGQEPTWFRAPVGHYNIFTHPSLRLLKLKLMAWSCRGFDTVAKDVSQVIQRLEPDLKPGAIILLHDVIPNCVPIVDATLNRIKALGLKCADPHRVL